MSQHAHAHAGNGQWSNGLMTCTPIGDCCLGTWCPCILYGRTVHRERDPTLANYEKTNDECKRMGHCQCWTGCGFIYVKRQRTELREKYGIPGSTNNDCWATFCCLPCAQIQLDKEVELRESRVNKEGYRRQDGMTMPNHDPNAPTMGAPAMGQQAPPPQMEAAPYQQHAPASHGIAPATSGSYATPQQDSKHPIDSKPPPPQY
ncbi:PLAC8 family protein [Sarocladium implicatum]|nr:PLAC8 family protein [Sarocladium implicatum]